MSESSDRPMTFEDVLKARRSVRGFLDKPVPREIITRAFDLAQLSPSNSNIQPWQVFVASGKVKDTIREQLLAEITAGNVNQPDFSYPGRFENVYRTRQVDCAVAMYNEMGIARDDKVGRLNAMLRNFEFFDAPHIAFFCMEKSFPTTVAVDLGIYAQTLMLAFTAMGVSSCAMGSMRSYPNVPRAVFGFGDNLGVLFGMTFGYEDTTLPVNRLRMGRRPFEECVTFKE
ncbi:nitroreductase [bacterium]|nr:nitroreductase [bacterium]